MTDREEFLQIFRQHVTRPAAKSCWTGWTTRPISFRLRRPPGSTVPARRAVHAQPERLPRLHDTFFTEGESEESFAICAMLHDLCKANYYKAGTRNVKNETTGQWEKVPCYSVEDLFPTATVKKACSSLSAS